MTASTLTTTEPAKRAWRRNRAALLRTLLSPPPKLTVSAWADAYRVLSRESSAEPGRWRTDRAPYQRGIMDALSDPLIERVVFMKPSQVGATEILNNIVGFYVDQDPAPILVVQPNVDPMAKAWSTDRLAPMLRDTPRLRGKVRDPRSRDSGNTKLHKIFPGGHITVVGANSAAGLASRPIRIALFDEVDRYPASAGSEGDPIALGVQRTATFWNRKIFLASTPTLKGLSRIEVAYLEGDQQQYHVACVHCSGLQLLTWSQLRWDEGRPETAQYVCLHCAATIPETAKMPMLERGRWIAQAPGRRTASFHLNALYSTWARWPDLATEWLEAQNNQQRLQVFVNTKLGETWEERGGGLEPGLISGRKEAYAAEVPTGVGLLTMGVDVQDDRLEYVVRGWGAGEESWLIAFERILGDTARPFGKQGSPWNDLEQVRLRSWKAESGQTVKIFATGVDSGFQTDAVYAYCGPRYGQRTYALKGSSSPGKPLVPRRPTRNNKARIPLFEVGTNNAKDIIHGMLRISEKGQRYMHLPDPIPAEWPQQVTSERKIRKKLPSGKWVSAWVLPIGARNEALDCEAYALVALRLTPVRMAELAKMAERLAVPVEKRDDPPPPEPDAPQAPPPDEPEPPRPVGRRPRARFRVKSW